MTDNRLHEKVRAYRDDPVLFVREVIGVEPTEQQSKILSTMAKPGAKGSFRSGHGTGKSASEAWLILWFVSLFPNCRVPCTAPTQHQLFDVLWGEVAKWRQKMHPWFKDQLVVTNDRVYLKGAENTQFAVARTARKEQPEGLQGFHADHLLFIIEEASGVPEPVFEVAQGALSTPNARVLMCANPTQTTGYFYNSHNRMKHVWTRGVLSCEDSPLVAPEYLRDMKQQYGEESDIYRVRVKGEFPNAAITQLIPRALAEEASARKLHPSQYEFAPKVLGVDVAWEGDDRSCVVLRQGIHSRILGQWRNIDNMTLGGLVAQYEDKHGTDATFIDVGWGSGVIDYLRSIGRDPIPVNFGGKAIKTEFVNKRSEMWCEILAWLRDGGQIQAEDDLIDDLAGPEYYFAPNGRKGLERKKDMKKRGLPSPDLADALALTFAAPVTKKQRGPDRINPFVQDREFAKSDYDVLAV